MERTTLTERLRQAEAEIAAGRAEQALAYCQELQTAYPRALRVQRVLGQIFLALRRPREALAALDRALAGDPEDVRACCARALVHQMHGDDAAALAWYGRACDLRPDDQSLRATYRELARRLGQPPYRPTRAGLARLYLRGDLFAHAIREWEQLVIERPDMLDAQVGLAETLWLAGHAHAAEDRCRRILANAPSCVKAMLIQMALALADGDMDSAQAHLQRTLQLDPDMAIAQVCFADALAAGDPVLLALLRPGASADSAEDAATKNYQTAGFAQSGPLPGQRNLSRPLVASAPNAEPAFVVTQQTSQPLPPPPRPEIPVDSQPTEVTRAFRETAFMIWGKDEDTQPRIPAQQPTARGAEPGDSPALRELSGAMDDEETRRALNWYNWLQSQGAVSLNGGTAGPAAQIPPPPMPPPRGPGAPVDSPAAEPGSVNSNSERPAPAPRLTMPIPPATPTVPLPQPQSTVPLMPTEPQPMDLDNAEEEDTAELPLPSPDALRTMFAELGGNTAGPAVVESGNEPPPVFALDSVRDAPASPTTSPTPEVEVPDVPEDPYAGFAAMPPDASHHETVEAAAPADLATDVATGGMANAGDEQSPEPHTLEDLERQFAASGFTPIDTRPGLLARIERDQPSAPADVHDTTGADQLEHPVESQPVESQPAARDATPSKPAEPTLKETGPDPRDYPARLAHARKRRDDGQLDEALREYRAIIKNAPDLLPEVLNDLRASLDALPDHPNLHSVLGDALVSQGEYEKALESYNKATQLSQARGGGA